MIASFVTHNIISIQHPLETFVADHHRNRLGFWSRWKSYGTHNLIWSFRAYYSSIFRVYGCAFIFKSILFIHSFTQINLRFCSMNDLSYWLFSIRHRFKWWTNIICLQNRAYLEKVWNIKFFFCSIQIISIINLDQSSFSNFSPKSFARSDIWKNIVRLTSGTQLIRRLSLEYGNI